MASAKVELLHSVVCGSGNCGYIVYTRDMSSTHDLADLLGGTRWVALTGAGISTDSGIPDYRGPNARPASPMLYDDFTGSSAQRRRYWARSMVGWQTFRSVHPNPGHYALAQLRDHGLMGVITQNVDGLHQAAGSDRVIELHGSLARVRCLNCGTTITRDEMQAALLAANPSWEGQLPYPPDSPHYRSPERLRPDGDAEVDDWSWVSVVSCHICGGMWKPDVVFFGESVPRQRSTDSFTMIDAADALLVAGSSLTVMSGLKYVRHAAKRGLPVAILNQGQTRADEIATVRIDGGISPVLTELAELLR